jgi:putative MATE family efflux protein
MHVSIAMNLMNIIGNALLIYLLGWGVAGAGAATLVSRAIAALIMMRLITKQGDTIRIDSLMTIKLDWQIIKKILHIGIPSGIEGSLFQVGKILVQSLVATFGTAALAANAVASSIAGFLNIPGTAIGLATITVVGQCVGAGDTDQASYFTKRLMATTFILLAAVTAVLFLLMPYLVGLFGLGSEVTELASQLLRTFFLVNIVFWPLSFSLPQALRAAGDARFTMTASIASMWLFRIGLSYLLGGAFGLGLAGVWYAMYVDWMVRSCCFVTRFVRGSWKHKRVI